MTLPTSLTDLYLWGFQKLISLSSTGFQSLNSLRDLSIKLCPNLVSFPEEGFPTNLTSLTIGCDDEAECFPDEEIGMTLPTSLTHLSFWGFQKLIFLSSTGFQSLTSLQSLRIWNCPNLTSFPEVGLPSSLLDLYIRDCPKLKRACKRDEGKEWSKIAHIPCVQIDGKFMYDPELEE